MYLIAKDKVSIKSNHGFKINLDISKVWKVIRTPACDAGEYALFLKDDNDKSKFTIFQGYISYNTICEFFEMIKFNKEKDPKEEKPKKKKRITSLN